MKGLAEPLNETEMDRLDAFLLDRLPEDEDTLGRDEGILDISELDGFMTAIVSGPHMIQPSRWLPAVWGDYEPVWESEEVFGEIFSLMIRHMNVIGATLMEYPEDFEPLFLQREVDGKVYLIVDEWCAGFLRGMELDPVGWSRTEDLEPLLDLLELFGSENGDERIKKLSDDEIASLQGEIAPVIRRTHAFWLAHRSNNQTIRRQRPKVGRNDPCPCGSGRKFKKCCGAGPTLH